MQAGFQVKSSSKLMEAGTRFLEAAREYRKAFLEDVGGAAVIWLTDKDGSMVIFTRGEYRSTLMENIHRLEFEHTNLEPV